MPCLQKEKKQKNMENLPLTSNLKDLQMTRNEQIARLMGWECPDPEAPVPFYENEWFDLSDMNYVKLLQQHMVNDGWDVEINHTAAGILITATIMENGRQIAPTIMTKWYNTEPAAIVELFCKVYNITENKGDIEKLNKDMDEYGPELGGDHDR